MNPEKKDKSFSWLEYGLLLLCFSICMTGAFLLPTDDCPDEAGRLLMTEWIVQTGSLPTGNETQTMIMPENAARLNAVYPPVTREIGTWGFSYALRPFFSSMVGALFQKLTDCFTDAPRLLLVASRLCSVLSVTFCCFFCLLLGHRLFMQRSSALLFAAFVCFLPQVTFLGMYQNNDALSLCAVSMMLYFLIEGYDRRWSVKSCVGLAVGFSLGLLSYYSIYGWLLMGMVFLILAVLMNSEISGKGQLILKRCVMIAGICQLLVGWFFIRNAILHNGDFLGIATEQISRAHMREQGYVLYDYVCYRDERMSFWEFFRMRDEEWLRMTAQSFVGVFGYMTIYLPLSQYGLYGAIIGFGILLFYAVLLHRRLCCRDALLTLIMFISAGITLFLHFWHSYARDYQPQGRYIITLIIPLAYMLAYGMDKTSVTIPDPRSGKPAVLHPAAALTLIWLALFAWAGLGTMTKMLL